MSPASTDTSAFSNPLLAPWEGPFGGVPPFDRVRVEDFPDALEHAMAAERANIDAIATNSDPPTFENTVAALEGTGELLERVGTLYAIWGASRSSPAMRAVRERMAPRLAAHSDWILQHAALFARLRAVYEARDALSAEDARLVWVRHREFVRAGACLDAAEKARVADINAALATLYTRFGANLLADEEEETTEVPEAGLAGLPAPVVAASAAAAAARGRAGWLVVNTRSAVDPFLTYAHDRSLREQVWRTFMRRGERANKPLVTEILRLRAERARLLGYETHAHWRLDGSMAGTPERAMALLEGVWPAAVARVKDDVAAMQAMADGDGVTIAPWDFRYYAEKVRKARFDVDQALLRPYFRLDRMREGMFWAAGRLYGLTFTPVSGLPVFDGSMEVFEVRRNGEHLGLFYFDPFARSGKRSGAWAGAYRVQRRRPGVETPIISNNCNFLPGESTLSLDDARILFHEFGHALHGLLSDVTWPSLAGTAVFRDYVEFPSQLNERWLLTPELLARFAVNEQGESIPPELVARIKAAATFNEGFATTEYLSSALVDMALHLAGDTPIDPDTFEQDTLARLGMPPEMVMRHRIPQFAHVFSSDGYSGAYYSYIWADTLVADAAEAFREAPGGFYDTEMAERLVRCVLSVGNSVDPADGFRRFRGRDVETKALMRDRGFSA